MEGLLPKILASYNTSKGGIVPDGYYAKCRHEGRQIIKITLSKNVFTGVLAILEHQNSEFISITMDFLVGPDTGKPSRLYIKKLSARPTAVVTSAIVYYNGTNNIIEISCTTLPYGYSVLQSLSSSGLIKDICTISSSEYRDGVDTNLVNAIIE